MIDFDSNDFSGGETQIVDERIFDFLHETGYVYLTSFGDLRYPTKESDKTSRFELDYTDIDDVRLSMIAVNFFVENIKFKMINTNNIEELKAFLLSNDKVFSNIQKIIPAAFSYCDVEEISLDIVDTDGELDEFLSLEFFPNVSEEEALSIDDSFKEENRKYMNLEKLEFYFV